VGIWYPAIASPHMASKLLFNLVFPSKINRHKFGFIKTILPLSPYTHELLYLFSHCWYLHGTHCHNNFHTVPSLWLRFADDTFLSLNFTHISTQYARTSSTSWRKHNNILYIFLTFSLPVTHARQGWQHYWQRFNNYHLQKTHI